MSYLESLLISRSQNLLDGLYVEVLVYRGSHWIFLSKLRKIYSGINQETLSSWKYADH